MSDTPESNYRPEPDARLADNVTGNEPIEWLDASEMADVADTDPTGSTSAFRNAADTDPITAESLVLPTVAGANIAGVEASFVAGAEASFVAGTEASFVAGTEASATAGTEASVAAVDANSIETALYETKRVIVGQERLLERIMICLLTNGHCLLEGVPGIAKTLTVETLAKVVGGSFVRIQFTPDLLPADIVGTRIWRSSSESFDVELGPIAANFVLADEINRAPAKVQSALLEAMAERQVSVGGVTFPMPKPFLVLATQNPIESEGVYPLPEAQRDRFLMKIVVDYPTPLEEVEIVQRMGVNPPVPLQRLDLADLVQYQADVKEVFVDRKVIEYAVGLTMATREPASYGMEDLAPLLTYGASPRASLGLVAAGRAMALLRGRDYVVPQDVFDVTPEVMRHRIVLSYEAIARDINADHIVSRIMSTVPAPRISARQDAAS